MTQKGFNETMAQLIEVFGDRKFSPTRIKIIWDSINDLDDAWFRIFARRMIAEFNDSLNIVDAARGERRSRNDIERTNKIILDSSHQSQAPTGETLADILAKAGVKSVADLLNKPSNKAGEQEQK